mmetsp:Transcript_44348/g.125223  ORF Transcript_44348/g.125223 Transcript_44348/m.125223 type:complete len:467 (-) Transcript_44348:40-1440(-)
MVSVVWNLARDMYVVLLVVFLIEQFPGADLLDENMRKVIVAITAVVVITKAVQMLTGSGGGRSPARSPNRQKKVEVGRVATLEWASAEMQGWRPAMEDATRIVPSLAPPLQRHALFAVFDGHGGAEVSRIVAGAFPKVLASCANSLEATRGEGGAGSGEEADEEGGEEGDETKEGASPAGAVERMRTLVGKALHNAMLHMDEVLREGGACMVARGPKVIPPQLLRPGQLPEKKNAFDLVGSTAVVALVEFGVEPGQDAPQGCEGEEKEAEAAADATSASTAVDTAAAGRPQVGPRPLRISVANCGDSRAIVCRGGLAVELSEDHKPELEGEERRIVGAGGCVARVGPCHRIDRWGLNLSRALGDFHYKARADLPPEAQKVVAVPEIRTLELTAEDEFMVLACDGIFELHTSQRVVHIVRSGLQAGLSVRQVAADLVDRSCSPNLMKTCGKGGDNCSAIVVRLPAAS